MRLLDRTIRSYILYSCLLLLVAIPVFYIVLSRLVRNEIDDVLLSHKRDFTKASANFTGLKDLEHYPLLNEEFFITPHAELITTDSFYTEYVTRAGEPKPIPFRVVRTGITILGQPYELLVKESLLESEDLIAAIICTQIALITALLAGLILINRGLTRNIWKPFYQILHSLKQYDLEKHGALTLGQSKISEFEDLRQAIQHLLSKNHQTYLSQKEFTANASHEMQTPLAIVNAKLDLLMQTDQITREQASILLEVTDTTNQLSRLSRSLLLLAKIENDQFREVETVDVANVIHKTTEGLQELADEKNLSVTLTVQAHELLADPAQIEILISNLLSNAVRHTSPQGKIHITLSDGVLKVSNTGGPLQHPERIFERFQRDRSHSSGSGLGLSLVSKICERNSYAIAYTYRNDWHHFEVRFR